MNGKEEEIMAPATLGESINQTLDDLNDLLDKTQDPDEIDKINKRIEACRDRVDLIIEETILTE